MPFLSYDDDHKTEKTRYVQHFQHKKQGIQCYQLWCSVNLVMIIQHANFLGLFHISKSYTFKSEFCTIVRCLVEPFFAMSGGVSISGDQQYVTGIGRRVAQVHIGPSPLSQGPVQLRFSKPASYPALRWAHNSLTLDLTKTSMTTEGSHKNGKSWDFVPTGGWD